MNSKLSTKLLLWMAIISNVYFYVNSYLYITVYRESSNPVLVYRLYVVSLIVAISSGALYFLTKEKRVKGESRKGTIALAAITGLNIVIGITLTFVSFLIWAD